MGVFDFFSKIQGDPKKIDPDPENPGILGCLNLEFFGSRKNPIPPPRLFITSSIWFQNILLQLFLIKKSSNPRSPLTARTWRSRISAGRFAFSRRTFYVPCRISRQIRLLKPIRATSSQTATSSGANFSTPSLRK